MPPPLPYPPATVPDGLCHAGCLQTPCGEDPGPTVLNEAWRSMANEVADYDFQDECDTGFAPTLDEASWSCFAGDAGSHMAVEPPGDKTCGTEEAGWLSTNHPAVGEPPKKGTVCFDADDASFKDCFRQTEVLVCACSYDGGNTISYSYKLPAPPRCYSAYCGADDPLPPPMPMAPPLSPPPIAPSAAAPAGAAADAADAAAAAGAAVAAAGGTVVQTGR